MNSQARIAELETALETVIAYLHRLPLNIETGRVAREAQQVLESTANFSMKTATEHTPAGIPLIDVMVRGDTVTLKCPRVAPYAQANQLRELHSKLVTGMKMELTES